MSTYTVPQVKIFQEFTQTPAAITNPLRAFVFGPHYFLKKYSDGDCYVGTYSHKSTFMKSWHTEGTEELGAPVSSIIDTSFTKVYVKSALLAYYRNEAGGGAGTHIHAVYPYTNRIYVDGVNLQANGVYTLDSALPVNRGVVVGDVAAISNGTTTLYTPVIDIIPDYDAAAVDSVIADEFNASTVTETNLVADATGGIAQYYHINADAISGYSGTEDGFPTETYRITCTLDSNESGEGGRANVISASGTDNQYNIELKPTNQAIGTRGATFNWHTASNTQFYAGNTWTVTVSQDYTAPTVAAGGTFDSDEDVTYIVTVTKGSTSASGAYITVTSTTGVDGGGTQSLLSGTALPIGSRGAEITITHGLNGFCKNDKFYVVCTGRKATTYRTLVLADSLPEGLLWYAPSESSSEAGPDLSMTLYAKKDVELPEFDVNGTPNWTQNEAEDYITIASCANISDPEFIDTEGNTITLDLEGDDNYFSKVYIEYRALRQDHASSIETISDISEVVDELGAVSEDNPLALGVWYALRNANGTDVKYMAVPTNDLAGFSYVLDKAIGKRDVYTLVPLTKDATIQSAVAAHVDAMSTELKSQWRICFLNGDSEATPVIIGEGKYYPIGGTEEYGIQTCTIAADEDTGLFTVVSWTNASEITDNDGKFLGMGVVAGDLFCTNFQTNGDYDSYVIHTVANDQLTLVSGPASGISEDTKFEIRKSYTRNEEAQAYGAKAGVFGARRVYYVWPDVIEDAAGTQIDGFYACAAIAGLISGVVPQQGLTNVQLEGFSAVTRTTKYFSETQLNTMAGSGVWIIDQDPDTGNIYSRHEISTCTTDLNCRELMVTKNVDSISFTFFNQLRPYIGRANVTPRFLEQLRRQIMGTVDYLISNGTTPSLGGQLIGAEITQLRQHAINLDQVVVTLNITIPYPVNVIELHLVV